MNTFCVLCAHERIKRTARPGNNLCEVHITSELLRILAFHRSLRPMIAEDEARRVRAAKEVI